jgi:hypothetical protein
LKFGVCFITSPRNHSERCRTIGEWEQPSNQAGLRYPRIIKNMESADYCSMPITPKWIEVVIITTQVSFWALPKDDIHRLLSGIKPFKDEKKHFIGPKPLRTIRKAPPIPYSLSPPFPPSRWSHFFNVLKPEFLWVLIPFDKRIQNWWTSQIERGDDALSIRATVTYSPNLKDKERWRRYIHNFLIWEEIEAIDFIV